MKLYKLTDEHNKTHGGTEWGKGVTHRAKGGGKELCTQDVIHAYKHPLLAILLNPIHANFGKVRLWEAEGEVIAEAAAWAAAWAAASFDLIAIAEKACSKEAQ